MSKKKKAKVIQKKKIAVTKKLSPKKNIKITKKKPIIDKKVKKTSVLKKTISKPLSKKIVKPTVLQKATVKNKKIQISKKVQPTPVKKNITTKKTTILSTKNQKKLNDTSSLKNKLKPVVNQEIQSDYEKSYISEQETSAFQGNVLSKDFFDWKSIQENLRNLSFFHQKDSEECQEKSCDQVATSLGYCRFHYIKNIKKIKIKREILSQDRLQKAMEMLFSSYPPDVIEYLLKCLNEEKNFYQLLRDFNIADMDYQEEVAVVDEDEDDLGFPQTFLKQNFEE